VVGLQFHVDRIFGTDQASLYSGNVDNVSSLGVWNLYYAAAVVLSLGTMEFKCSVDIWYVALCVRENVRNY
jgi:hypothetical protein